MECKGINNPTNEKPINNVRLTSCSIQSGDCFATEREGEDDVHIEIEKLRTSVKESQKSVDEIRTEGRKLNEIEQKLAGLEKTLDEKDNRIKKLENQNKITIGKIKVPIELSGLVAAIVLITTGYLISSGSWEIIRSSYYAIAIGILFGAVVLVKF